MESIDAVVIGAGVVGLAVARALALSGRETVVLERHPRAGQETTSRNSGVIHSGIYYPHNSLKARMCVRGRQLLYDMCQARGIAHRRCGKLIVAPEAQLPALRALHRLGLANGVSDLQWLSQHEVHALEPHVRCAAGLLSPSTGVIDVHEYLFALIADLEARGGAVAYNSNVRSIAPESGALTLEVEAPGGAAELRSACVINCAGLSALELLRTVHGYPEARLRKSWYAKGNYFVLRGARPFRHLVYPMPSEAGLGVHATLDLDGAVRFGPDVQWVDAPDYDVHTARALGFYAAIREYWPALPDGALEPAYAGVRPKLVGPGEPAADFEIEGPDAHGLRGLVSLLGIESPGLTSSLALADEVVERLALGER